MTKQVWLPADGTLLKKLREEAEVEITTFARTHSLSVYQIKQLEDGGNSAFYSSTIKLATGRKLLMHFGADVQPFESVPEQIESLQLKITQEKIDSTKATNEHSASANSFISAYMWGLVTIFLSLISLYGYLILIGKNEKEPVNIIKLTVAAIPNEEKNDEYIKQDSNKSITTKTAQSNPNECKWTEEPSSVFVDQPSKPGDYVHVVAKTEGALCLRDAANKIHELQMKSLESQTIRGKPPFEISSKGLQEFKIYYQGNLLKLQSDDSKSIRLKEQKYE